MDGVKADKELLLKVAANARLKLTEKEIRKFLPQFEEVLKSFSKLDELDVKSEKPSYQPIPLTNVLREDIEKQGLTQEEALQNTKHKKDGYFKGPKII